MAWTARVLNILHGDTELRSLVEIGFYEANDPLNSPLPRIFLHKITLASESLTDIPALIAYLETEGLARFQDYTRVQEIKAALPIGAEITIPGT